MKYTDAVRAEKNGTLMKLDGNDNFVVCEPFVWFVDYEEKTGKILVPTGFITDLGSIPPFFRVFFSRNGSTAYILHDYMYHHGGKIPQENGWLELSRRHADRIMYQALRVAGIGVVSAYLQYLGVRLGGWNAWRAKCQK